MSQYADPDWVLGAARRMGDWGREDPASWAEAWRRTYYERGGNNRSAAERGSPRSAGYGLWFVGRIREADRPFRRLSIYEVDRRLGKNAAYAELALRFLQGGRDPEDLKELWLAVRKAFRQETGRDPAHAQAGALDVAAGLFLGDHVQWD